MAKTFFRGVGPTPPHPTPPPWLLTGVLKADHPHCCADDALLRFLTFPFRLQRNSHVMIFKRLNSAASAQQWG